MSLLAASRCIGIVAATAPLAYIDDHAIDRLGDVIADGADRLHAATDAASPLLLPVPQA